MSEVFITNGDGTTSIADSIDAYYDSVQRELAKNALELVSKMNASNVDLSLIGKATFISKEATLGGKKFKVCIHTSPEVTGAISRHSGHAVKSIIQIWNGSCSLIMLSDEDMLNDARKDWTGGDAIPADNLVEQTIASMRLNSNSPIVHHLAMFCAYEHDDIRGDLIHRVWD